MNVLRKLPFLKLKPPVAPDEVEQFRLSVSILRVKDVSRREAIAVLKTLRHLPELPQKECRYFIQVERTDGTKNRIIVTASDKSDALHQAFVLEIQKGYSLTKNYQVTACL